MKELVNGGSTQLLLWVANGLLTIVLFLLGLVVKMHADSDREHDQQHNKDVDALRTQVNKDLELHTKEIDTLRDRLHKHGNKVSEILTRMRWQDEDSKRGE